MLSILISLRDEIVPTSLLCVHAVKSVPFFLRRLVSLRINQSYALICLYFLFMDSGYKYFTVIKTKRPLRLAFPLWDHR